MAYTFAVGASAGNGSGGAITVAKPAGIVDGQLLVWNAYLETDTNTWTGTPSGVTVGASIVNTGIFSLICYWKIASSEMSSASWTFTPNTSNWRTVVFAAYDGALGTGTSRVDVTSASQGDGVSQTGQTAPSVTTTVNGDLVVFCYGNFGGTDPTSVGGFCTNLRKTLGGTAISDAVQATAGATGTSDPGGVGTQDYASMHVAFFLDMGGGAGGIIQSPAAVWSQNIPGMAGYGDRPGKWNIQRGGRPARRALTHYTRRGGLLAPSWLADIRHGRLATA